MKAQYAILRFAKYKGPEIGHIESHNERTKEKYASNPDVDMSRSHLNFHLVTPQRKYRAEVEKQIAKKLSLQGISLSDVAILRAQGGNVASMVTKDGKPNSRYAASMVDEAGMEKLLDFAKRKAAELAGEIYRGEMDDSPVERGAFNACQNCEYSAICAFDPMRKPRRRLEAKKLDDLL